MAGRFARGADRRVYGQRWQCETVNSMVKRNLGSALRARTAVRRRHELLLRVLTHSQAISVSTSGATVVQKPIGEPLPPVFPRRVRRGFVVQRVGHGRHPIRRARGLSAPPSRPERGRR
ncbi:MAG TPA: hypothetical protein VK324_08730, partial [Tepidisphaeraceae bacterium]|nr:hypothetical protein [Tepidisphaeraceae bacterium]